MRSSTLSLLLAAGASASLLTVNESYVPMTTSTVYATSTFTVTHCSALSSCQVPTTSVVTLTTAVSTTVCPVSDVETAASSILSLSLVPTSSIALTADATPYAIPSAASQTAVLPLSILTLSVGPSPDASTFGVSLLPSLPAAYSTLPELASAQPSSLTSAVVSQLTLIASTTAAAAVSTSNGLTLGISISLMGSASPPSIPAYGVPSMITSPAASLLVSNLVSAIASAVTSPAAGVTLSIGISGAASAISIPPITGLSPPAYVIPTMVSSASDLTSTQTLYISRTLTTTIYGANSSAAVVVSNPPANGASTLSMTAPARASNATSSYATPSMFLGAADVIDIAPGAIFVGFLSWAACFLG